MENREIIKVLDRLIDDIETKIITEHMIKRLSNGEICTAYSFEKDREIHICKGFKVLADAVGARVEIDLRSTASEYPKEESFMYRGYRIFSLMEE